MTVSFQSNATIQTFWKTNKQKNKQETFPELEMTALSSFKMHLGKGEGDEGMGEKQEGEASQ